MSVCLVWWSSDPLVEIFFYEGVVVEMGIGAVDAINLFHLSWGKLFSGTQTPASGEQSLATQYLMNAGDAAVETVRRIEEGGVGIGDLGGQRQGMSRPCIVFDLLKQIYRAA